MSRHNISAALVPLTAGRIAIDPESTTALDAEVHNAALEAHVLRPPHIERADRQSYYCSQTAPMKKQLSLMLVLSLGAVPSYAVTETIPTVSKLDLQRYMGPWFVIASIPTGFEKNGYAQVESYRLKSDGTIAATFSLRKGSFDGPFKTMHPHGFVLDSSRANWGMRVIWPIKSEYRISYINEEYTEVIVGRSKRDHVWIMARTPTIPAAAYQKLVERVGSLGYDTTLLWKVPQRDVATAGPNGVAPAH